MGINLSNVSTGHGNGANGARELDTLIAIGIPGGTRFTLPSLEERKRLAATGRFLEVEHSTTGPLQKTDPRSFVHSIRYVKDVMFGMDFWGKSCPSRLETGVEMGEIQSTWRKSRLYEFVAANGSPGYMIMAGGKSLVLLDSQGRAPSTREGALKALKSFTASRFRPLSEKTATGSAYKRDALLAASIRVKTDPEPSYYGCSGSGGC